MNFNTMLRAAGWQVVVGGIVLCAAVGYGVAWWIGVSLFGALMIVDGAASQARLRGVSRYNQTPSRRNAMAGGQQGAREP